MGLVLTPAAVTVHLVIPTVWNAQLLMVLAYILGAASPATYRTVETANIMHWHVRNVCQDTALYQIQLANPAKTQTVSNVTQIHRYVRTVVPV